MTTQNVYAIVGITKALNKLSIMVQDIKVTNIERAEVVEVHGFISEPSLKTHVHYSSLHCFPQKLHEYIEERQEDEALSIIKANPDIIDCTDMVPKNSAIVFSKS